MDIDSLEAVIRDQNKLPQVVDHCNSYVKCKNRTFLFELWNLSSRVQNENLLRSWNTGSQPIWYCYQGSSDEFRQFPRDGTDGERMKFYKSGRWTNPSDHLQNGFGWRTLKIFGPLSSNSRTNSDGERSKFHQSGRRTKADRVRSASPCCFI